MILSNVNIGTGPSSGDGDPLRSAFATINRNFQTITNNVNALSNSVTSVAGRTGNVQLTVNDIIGLNNYNFANIEYVNNAINNLVDTAPEALDTLNELAEALNNDANFASNVINTINQVADNKEFDYIEITKRIGFTGNAVQFVKPPYTDIDDEIDANLTLTRAFGEFIDGEWVGGGGAIYNSELENEYNELVSPAGTLWNAEGWANLDNVKSRYYSTFKSALRNLVGQNVVGTELVMHDLANDKYYTVKFSSWAVGPSVSGAFTYTRRLIDTETPVGITFADGTMLTSSPRDYWDEPQVFVGSTNTYVLRLEDRGHHIFASGSTIQIPSMQQVPFAVGATIRIITNGNPVNIIPCECITPSVIYRNGFEESRSLWTISAYSSSTLTKIGENVWRLTSDDALGTTGTGLITFDATTISAPNVSVITMEGKDSNGIVNSRLELNPEYSLAKLESVSTGNQTFYSGDGMWDTAVWSVSPYGYGILSFTGAEQLISFLDSTTNAWNSGENKQLSWNGGVLIEWPGYSYGGGNVTITLSQEQIPEVDPTEITEFYLQWNNVSRVAIDGGDYEELQISARGMNVEINSTGDVNIEAGDDLRITGRDVVTIRNESLDEPITIITGYDSSDKIWAFKPDGSLAFPDNNIQTTAYAGGVGRMMMIDTNRTDAYTEVGSADRPFTTFAAAIAAANAIASAEGATANDKKFSFVLMGCTVDENVDFSGTSFTSVTMSTTCRSIISGNVTIANIPTLSQMVVRNIEFGNTFTIAGDGTTDQMNSVSIYNASFSGSVNITATNTTAFYEAAFFGQVTFTNVNYIYINGAQFNTDLTFTVDDSGATTIPSGGVSPCIVIGFNFIANNVYMTKVGSGSGFLVFQPHMARMGLGAGNYTIPTNFVFQPQGCAIRGTWTNNGSTTLRNSSFDVAVQGTAPAYTGVIGGDRVVVDKAPITSKGAAGDRVGMIAADASYLYVCTADYTDGLTDIWSRTAVAATTW